MDESKPPGMLAFLNAPNAVSLTGLFFAYVASYMALTGRLHLAMAALIWAGICDLADGVVARSLNLSEDEQRFGGQLDSLIDICSFGIAPVLIVMSRFGGSPLAEGGTVSAGWPRLLLSGIFFFYVAGCAWRLAYFNSFGLVSGGGKKYYVGLPVTFVALFLPIVNLSGFLGTGPRVNGLIAAGTLLVLGGFMLSSLKIPKPRGLAYPIFGLLAVILIGIYIWAHLQNPVAFP